jgi:protein-tyrosine kinase
MSLIEKALEKSRVRSGTGVQRPLIGADASASGTLLQTHRAERTVPARVITLDIDQLLKQGMIPPVDEQRRHAAQVRAIKNRLLQPVRKSGSARDRVIMVTSPLSGDGKTFNSISIALSMATEKDYHVLLVDGDIPKPNIGQVFGIEEAGGLLDAARDRALDPEQFVIGTDVPGLNLLPAGRGGVDSAEILSSSRMNDVIGLLAAVPNRIVLLDSPPLLLTSEATVLAQHAGQVVLVVREAVTPQRAVLDSLALLGDHSGVCLVLNGVSESRLEHLYYGYGQDYAYGDLAASQGVVDRD